MFYSSGLVNHGPMAAEAFVLLATAGYDQVPEAAADVDPEAVGNPVDLAAAVAATREALRS